MDCLLEVTLSSGSRSKSFEVTCAPSFARCFWIGPSVEVAVRSLGGDERAWKWYLKPLIKGGVVTAAWDDGSGGGGEGDGVLGVLVEAATERPFACTRCFKRLKTEPDARNHFRDRHGVRSFSSSSSSSPSSPGSASEAAAAGGGEGRCRFGALQVAFEDAWMAVVVKPQGIVSIGGRDCLAKDPVLLEALQVTSTKRAGGAGQPWP